MRYETISTHMLVRKVYSIYTRQRLVSTIRHWQIHPLAVALHAVNRDDGGMTSLVEVQFESLQLPALNPAVVHHLT